MVPHRLHLERAALCTFQRTLRGCLPFKLSLVPCLPFDHIAGSSSGVDIFGFGQFYVLNHMRLYYRRLLFEFVASHRHLPLMETNLICNIVDCGAVLIDEAVITTCRCVSLVHEEPHFTYVPASMLISYSPLVIAFARNAQMNMAS